MRIELVQKRSKYKEKLLFIMLVKNCFANPINCFDHLFKFIWSLIVLEFNPLLAFDFYKNCTSNNFWQKKAEYVKSFCENIRLRLSYQHVLLMFKSHCSHISNFIFKFNPTFFSLSKSKFKKVLLIG